VCFSIGAASLVLLAEIKTFEEAVVLSRVLLIQSVLNPLFEFLKIYGGEIREVRS
tara:strand:- start:154 stop:318 length:165 start_codon:yes stop_codon:yes gene_type:complete